MAWSKVTAFQTDSRGCSCAAIVSSNPVAENQDDAETQALLLSVVIHSMHVIAAT